MTAAERPALPLTADVLRAATGCTPDRAALYAPHLSAACAHFGINTPERLAAFLAQLAHESGSLRYVREIASGEAYEGRKDLGNTQPGDGARYRGRGLIQVTGRSNYRASFIRMKELGAPDFEADPTALETPEWACWSAADWWHNGGLNGLADRGEYIAIGRQINRGNRHSDRPANGEPDRLARWEVAKRALAASTAPIAEPPHTEINAPTTEQEKRTMPIPAIIGALLPSLVNLAPQLIRVFGGGGEISERNAKAAEVVAQVAREVTGQPTTEGAVQALESDPQAAARYREQIHQTMGELLGHLTAATEVDEKTRSSALDRNLELGKATGGRWLWLLGGAAGTIVLFSLAVVWMVLFGSKDFSEGVKMLLLGQVVLSGFSLVTAFLFGTNLQNRISQQQGQRPESP